MFKLVIQDDEGKTTMVPLIRDEITIGRKEGNTIRLTERNVSRRHARILRNNGEVHIEDLGSYNGIRVNNARIAERVALRVSDQVQIGDYKLFLKADGQEQAASDDPMASPTDHAPVAAALAPAQALEPPMSAPAGTAPHAILATPSAPQLIGSPNRTMVALPDDPNGRSIGPATQEAIDAIKRPTGYGRLVVLSSNFAGREFELSRPQMIIGRTDENDIVVNHRSISRNHAKLVREPETGRYTISDLQSSNGVRVNGQDYGKVELRRGDIIDLGHVRLRFIEPGEDFVFARDAVITDVPEAGGKRGMIMAIIAAVLVVAAGIVVYSMHSPDKPKEGSNSPVVGPGPTGSDTPGSNGHDTAPPPPDNTGTGTGDQHVATTPTGSNTETAATKPDGQSAQVAACAELNVKRKWQDLLDCAKGLGPKDDAKSKQFQTTAIAETKNESINDSARKALQTGNLRDAQNQLKSMSPDSVYFNALNDAFDKADAPSVEAIKTKVRDNAHNCDVLKRLASQVAATGTDRAVFVAKEGVVKCEKDKAALAAEAPHNPGKPLNPVTPNPTPTGTQASSQAKLCENMNVEDLMTQASNQYNSGYASAALLVVTKALACKQDTRMYRLAATYACAAHDASSARTYFAKVPQQYQAAIQQKCQLEHTDLGLSNGN